MFLNKRGKIPLIYFCEDGRYGMENWTLPRNYKFYYLEGEYINVGPNNCLVFYVFSINERLWVDIGTAVSNADKNFDNWSLITREIAANPEYFRLAHLVEEERVYTYEDDTINPNDNMNSVKLLTAETDRPLMALTAETDGGGTSSPSYVTLAGLE